MILGHVSSQLAEALPREVIDALDLLPGDEIEYVIEDGGVRISRPADRGQAGSRLSPERVRALIQEGLDDPRPPIPAEQAFAELRARLERRRRDDA